jgi:uncharacterized protein YndB with AHSA1/START domain
MPGEKTAITAKGREIVIERVFDAPLELVWKTWTEPERTKLWWGPKDFTCPFAKSDFRVGGEYLYAMRDAGGKDYWSGGVYREIVPMERIVATDHFADEHGKKVPPSHYGMEGEWPTDDLVVTVTFEDLGGKTKLTLHHAGFPAADMGETQGWNESLDKFAEALRR